MRSWRGGASIPRCRARSPRRWTRPSRTPGKRGPDRGAGRRRHHGGTDDGLGGRVAAGADRPDAAGLGTGRGEGGPAAAIRAAVVLSRARRRPTVRARLVAVVWDRA